MYFVHTATACYFEGTVLQFKKKKKRQSKQKTHLKLKHNLNIGFY